MMYKLLFIDEQRETLEDFEEYVEKSQLKDKFNVITIFPSEDMEEMIHKIFKIAPDALITDFRLNEMKEDITYNVPFNGVDIVQEFQSYRYSFPCFVLTAVDDEAVGSSEDVNIVYVKNILYKDETEKDLKAKASFLDRIFMQIEHYKNRLAKAEKDLADLLIIRENEDTNNIEIENKIIELDDFLEKSIDRRSSIPEEFKKLSNITKLDSLLDKVDQLVKKVEENGK
jgi:hypothetical protein